MIDFSHPLQSGTTFQISQMTDPSTGRTIEQFVPQIKRECLAIVGFASSSRDEAPYQDASWDIWGMNQLYRFIPRADCWFEMHHNYLTDAQPTPEAYQQWLATCPLPVLMCERRDEVPQSLAYPLDAVSQYFPSYFTSSVAYMLALGIYCEYKVIGLYGIDLIAGTEYAEQKPCVEFLLGYAHARGIHIKIPDSSALVRPELYGYKDSTKYQGLLEIQELKDRKARLSAERDQALARANNLEGAVANLDELIDGATLRVRGGTWAM